MLTSADATLAFEATLLILCVKALLLGMATAALRGKEKTFINAEDAAWLGGQLLATDPESVARIGRAHRNDLENLLLFAIAGTVLIAAQAAPLAVVLYSLAFLCARIVHSLAYLRRRPLWRRNAYTLGFVVILAQAVHAGIALM